MQRVIWAAFGLVILIGLEGCGQNTAGGVHPVRGKVLFNGQPVANAQVTFHPLGDQSRKAVRPVGKVDDQGNFTLTSFKNGDGTAPGEYQVTVVWFLARPPRAGSDETTSANYLPAKYASVETSKLTATVVPGTNDLRPFELK